MHGYASRRMGSRRVRLAAWCLAAVVAQTSAGCFRSQGARQLFELVPATSVVAASVDWDAVRDDDGLRRVIPFQGIEQMFGDLGLTSSEVGEFVVFGDGRDARVGSTGLILRGQFDAGEVVERLKERGWREQGEGGGQIYVGPNGQDYCAALDDMLVVGSRAGVSAVVGRGDESFASNPTYEKLTAHLEGSDGPVQIVVAAPQRVQDMADAGLAMSSAVLGFAHMDMVAGLVRQLGAVRGVGCALGHRGQAFPVELVAVMRDEETAGLVSGTLNLAQRLAPAVAQPADAAQREAFEQFGQMSVERDEDVLAIKVVMTEAQMRGR